MNEIQTEIFNAIKQMNLKEIITEANLAKKVRENNKIEGKKKAGLCIGDVEFAIENLKEENIFYEVHLNSVNEILLKKSTVSKILDADAKHRRLQSEKSILVFTNADLKNKNNKHNKKEKRTERKSININSYFDEDY